MYLISIVSQQTERTTHVWSKVCGWAFAKSGITCNAQQFIWQIFTPQRLKKASEDTLAFSKLAGEDFTNHLRIQ